MPRSPSSRSVASRSDADDAEQERDDRLREGVYRPRHGFAVRLAELGRVGIAKRRGDERERVPQQEEGDEREQRRPELQRDESEARPRRPGVDVLLDARERAVGVDEVIGAGEVRPQQCVREQSLEARYQSGADQGREQDHDPDRRDREDESEHDAEGQQRPVPEHS